MTRLVDIEYIRNALGITGTAETCNGCRYDKGYELCATHLAPSFAYVCAVLDDEPTVDAGPKWIPVSEKLPDEFDEYMCTCIDKYTARLYTTAVEFCPAKKDPWVTGATVIAWLEHPKPYEVKQ